VEAEHVHSVALKNQEKAYANQALLRRASIYRLSGDLDRARTTMVEVEPELRSNLSPGDPGIGQLLSEQALLAQARGDAQAALDRIREALSLVEASAQAGHKGAELIPIYLAYQSDMERQVGHTDAAVADANRALTSLQAALQPGTFSSHLGRAYLALGRALQDQGKHDQALSAFRSAAENLQQTLGPEHPDAQLTRQLAESGAAPTESSVDRR
jgi:tetratricopeptide (TPR) repeat protein